MIKFITVAYIIDLSFNLANCIMISMNFALNMNKKIMDIINANYIAHGHYGYKILITSTKY